MITTIGDHSQVAIDKCLTKMPNVRVSMLHQIYQMKYESRMLHAAENWGIDGRAGNGGRNTGEIL